MAAMNSCARLHPDIPSDISRYKCDNRLYCRVCNRARARNRKRDPLTYAGRILPRLMWAPPKGE